MGAKKQNKTLSTQESHKARCMTANWIVGVGGCHREDETRDHWPVQCSVGRTPY